MRWFSNSNNDKHKWHRWFAWRPVSILVDTGWATVWLEDVERSWSDGVTEFSSEGWDYRFIGQKSIGGPAPSEEFKVEL